MVRNIPVTGFDEKAKTWDLDPVRADRARKVAEAIRAAVPLNPGMKVFEFGCGTGLLGFALKPFVGPITLADSSPGMIAVLKEKILAAGAAHATGMHPLLLDLSANTLPEERFDMVCSLMVLHHVPDTGKILRDFHSLLVSPGYVCAADLDREDGLFHGTDFDGHRGFDREALAEAAESAGFRNVRFKTVMEIVKGTAKGSRAFPLFLLIGEKT
jgi:ubiquinone/menaquinone biosynthesis C-methylase UbiE